MKVLDCYEWAINEAKRRKLKSVHLWVDADEYYPIRDWTDAYHAAIKLNDELYDLHGKTSISMMKKRYKNGNKLVRVSLSRILSEYPYVR